MIGSSVAAHTAVKGMIMAEERARSKLQEDLVSLYLRLNGFFVTRFIVHSPTHGQNRTELDALALRHPFNAEPERQIDPDPLLDLSEKYIDLALCEVKSKGQPLQFNPALVKQPSAIETILRWSGLFQHSAIGALSKGVAAALTPRSPAAPAVPAIAAPGDVRIRGLLFSPERHSRRENQPWFVTGPQIFSYVSQCLSPATLRSTCATTYDFQLWGDHEPIVRYFKSRSAGSPGDFDALFSYVEKSEL